MKILIVDSHKELCYDLRNLLSLYRSFQVIDTFLDTTEEAADYIDSHEIDVVFINNQPANPRCTSQGPSLATFLANEHPDVQVVVYADSEDAAYHAYRSQCAGFLLTPFDPLAVQALVERLIYIYGLQQAKRETAERSIMIKTHNGYQLTRLNDILFIERNGRGNRIVTTDGQEIALQGYSMNQLDELLRGNGFFRCYQSFIVNLSKVSAVHADSGAKNYTLHFKDYEGGILLSRKKYAEIMTLLKDRYARLNI